MSVRVTTCAAASWSGCVWRMYTPMKYSRRSNVVSPRAPTMSDTASHLARWRVTLGFLFGVFAFWLARPTRATVLAGAVIATLGEAIRIWAAGHLQKSREVTTSGPYRWSAHPLYVGSSIMGLGLAVASGSLVVAVLVVVYVAATMTAAMKSEEAFLRKTFGDEYDRYRQGLASSTPNRRFSMSQVVANHEHRAVVGLLLAMLLLALKAAANV